MTCRRPFSFQIYIFLEGKEIILWIWPAELWLRPLSGRQLISFVLGLWIRIFIQYADPDAGKKILQKKLMTIVILLQFLKVKLDQLHSCLLLSNLLINYRKKGYFYEFFLAGSRTALKRQLVPVCIEKNSWIRICNKLARIHSPGCSLSCFFLVVLSEK